MAQWIGMGTGTHESRVVDAETTLRRAVESLLSAGPEESARARKNVVNLAKKLLSARLRQRKARLSQQRERATQKGPEFAADLDALERTISEMQLAGVQAILEEFGVPPAGEPELAT